MNKAYLTQFAQLLSHFPCQTQWKTMPDAAINLALIIKKNKHKDVLPYFSQAASMVSRENIRFHLIQGKQAINLLPQLTAMQNEKFTADEWQTHLSMQNAVLITAFSEKGPIGFVLGHQEEALKDAYIIDDLALAKEYQNRGIGSWLLKSIGWLAFELRATQLIGYIGGKEPVSSQMQAFLRGVGAEEIFGGISGGHYLQLDLTALCLVPSYMSHGILLGCTTGRAGAWVQEAADPCWHRRLKTSRVPEEIKQEKGGIGEEVMAQSKKVQEPKTLVELLKGLNWKEAPNILPYEKELNLARMRKDPLTAASFDQPFCARLDIIPFIKETYLFRYILDNFKEVSIEADGSCFVLISKGQKIGQIKAGPKNGIFEVSYQGKTHPQGKDEQLLAIGHRRVDQALINVGDLYCLMNICFHFQHLESRFKEQAPLLTQVFYTSLRGSHAASALLVILFSLNHMEEALHINNFVNALVEAAEADWSFYSFWVLVKEIIIKGPGWDRINLACEYILKTKDFNNPICKQICVWTKAEGEFNLEDEIYKKAYGPLIGAIIQMIEAGALREDLDQMFAAAMTAKKVTPAFNLFFVAPDLFEKGGVKLFQDLIDCLGQSPVFEKYSTDLALGKYRHLLAEAAAGLLLAGEKDAVQVLFSASEIDQDFGALLANTIVTLGPLAARFIVSLLPEIRLCKDRRIREKLRQVILTAQGWLDGGEGEKIFELMKELRPANAYDKLDQLYYLLQFSSDVIEARILIAGGMYQLQQHLFEKMLKRFRISRPYTNWPAYSAESFVRSVSQLLRQKQAVDPNIGLLLAKVSRHGSIQHFYREDENAQRTIKILQAQGYNVEQLVFGTQALMQSQGKTGTTNDLYSTWFEIAQVAQLLFGEEFGTAFLARIERMKDPEQAKILSFEYVKLLREKISGVPGTSQRTSRRKEELNDLLNGVEWQARHGVYIEGGRIESRKSNKAVPEILFDNRRLACCIFFPDGELRNEIPLVAMDPQTPAVEFWLSEMSEFAGIAIEYAGKDRELLLDTFEFNQSLTAALGGDPTFRFVTDSLILDAHLSYVKNLLIFDCNYGHPLRYVRYVRKISGQEAYKGIVRFEEKYPFELADLENQALRHSKSGVSMHYTDAFRIKNFRRGRMKGRIPVFVIDVEAYFQKFKERIDSGKVII